jgi:predicted short-subunit dehydrogenase-like oxidoreductase (DUF2520 family)
MRELDRTSAAETSSTLPAAVGSVGVVGNGRMGRALAAALRAAGYDVAGPAGRGEVPAGEAIVLCVPDGEIAAAAAAVAGAARYVGHTSGATPLTALAAADAEAFGLHPLQTVTGQGADLRDCGCAIAGSTGAALGVARDLAESLGMRPFEVHDDQRAAYHAAASIASNYLVALEWAAETVARRAGVEAPLGPLVRTTVENWIDHGAHAALTGPIKRGDHETVARQRAAVAEAAPELVPLFDVMAERTRELAR